MRKFIKKTFLLLVVICLVLVLVDVNRSKKPKQQPKPLITQTQRDFVEGCQKGGLSSKLCSCMYKEFRFTYGDAILGDLNHPALLSRHSEKIERIQRVCERQQQLSTRANDSFNKKQ